MYPEITVPVEVMTTLCQLPSQTCRGPGRVVVAPGETGMTEIKIEEAILDPPHAITSAPLASVPPVELGH
jgi:hypothetical protein